MSLEQIIKDNTAALIANTAALLASASAPLSLPSKQPAAAAANPPAAPGVVTYPAVAAVVGEFVKANGRAPAEILLKPFNVKTLIPLKEKPAELAGVLAAFNDPAKTAAAIADAAAAKAAGQA